MLCFDEMSLSWTHAMWRPRFDSLTAKWTRENRNSQVKIETVFVKHNRTTYFFIIIHITLLKYKYYTIVIIIIIMVIMANKARITTSILRSLLSLVFVILFKGYDSHVFSGRFSMTRWQQSHFDHQECSLFQSFVFQTNARVISAEDYYVYNNNHTVSRHSQFFIEIFRNALS